PLVAAIAKLPPSTALLVAKLPPVTARPAMIAGPVVTAPAAVAVSPNAGARPPAVARATLPPAVANPASPPIVAPSVGGVVPPPVASVAPPIALPATLPKVAVAANPAPAAASMLRSAQTPQPEETAARARLPKREPAPLPFDAVLGTILYSPDRKLAIIDGHIVQADDDVRGARVIDITPTAVLLRD